MTAPNVDTDASDGIEKWDLTATISPYLDRHMIFPLFDYLEKLIDEGSINYSKREVSEARLALLRPTNMIDYAIDIHKSIHGADATVPPEMETQKAQVLKDLEDLKQRCAPLEEIGDEERVRIPLFQS
jgi:translation initiation factor 3 subunit E